MSYKLTLTRSERAAIDWVGHRYAHGDRLFELLYGSCMVEPADVDWDQGEDFDFVVPESVAWQISELIDEDNLACFADPLKEKLYEFQAKIV